MTTGIRSSRQQLPKCFESNELVVGVLSPPAGLFNDYNDPGGDPGELSHAHAVNSTDSTPLPLCIFSLDNNQ